MIPQSVRDAFALRGESTQLPGGVTGVRRVGNVVVKPVTDAAEADWVQSTFAALPPAADVRWARPIAAADGRFVVDGWIAHDFVTGLTPVAPDWARVVELGARFHRATATIPPPAAMLRARTHRWARGEQHAFDEDRVALPARAAAIDAALSERCAHDAGPAQVVHVDLATNVFTDRAGTPLVLDISPAARSCSYASASVVADALLWHDAALDLVGVVDRDPARARSLVARALRFRLAAEQIALLARELPAHRGDLTRYEQLLRRWP